MQRSDDSLRNIISMMRRPVSGSLIFSIRRDASRCGSFDRSLIYAGVPQDTYEREKEAAMRVLILKFKRSADRQKMLASLYRSGFDSSALQAAVTEYIADIEE